MKICRSALFAGAMVLASQLANAQQSNETPPAQQDAAPQAAEPAPPAGEKLPEVEVIQKKAPVQAQQAAPKKKAVAKPAPTPVPEPVAEPVIVDEGATAGDTVQMSPLGGSEIPLAKVPSAVSTVTSTDISTVGTKQIQQVLQQYVPGIILSDAAGNPLRAEVSYRGFDASPVGGRAQGLAVYQNGVRINEAFGDTVNWDVLPTNAISSMSVISNNPVFGLNAIGGAVSILMKDGFNYQGAEFDVMGGSFGRKQVGAQVGAKSGNVGAYVAAEGVEDDGFRDFGDTELRRFYGDIGFKGSLAELHFSLTAANNSAGVTAAAPLQLLREDWSNTYTNPQVTDIEVLMPTISGSVKATDTLTLSGVGYFRRFKSNVIDGNLSEIDECDAGGPNAGFLCLAEDGAEEVVEDAAGNPVAATAVDDPLGSIERINTKAESWGGSVQAVEKARIFNRPNQFLVGMSYDHGEVDYDTSSELGTIGPKFVVTGSGIIVVEPDDVAPRALATENDYYGIYFSNTLDITDAFALTVGGRYNNATIKLTDLTGDFPELNTTNDYERFNPMVGGTYKFFPGLSVYGGYSEANRAPTAAELGCAEPDNPCFIESFLTDDPPLKQVVSHTYEFGFRGVSKSAYTDARFTWSAGLFRTLNTDDIINVAAEQTGRGFFLNAGDTLRQGIELAAQYQTGRFQVYGSYAFVDATFDSDLVLPAPNTPEGTEDCPGAVGPDAEQCNFVSSGDRMPGIPRHRFKAGFVYWLTPQWKFGSDMVAATDQIFFGDEANNNKPLAGYVRFDLHTSYDITENVQVYGLVRNLFDQKYGLYGTYFDPEEANEASGGTGVTFGSDARSISPSQPFAAYGGMKIRF